MTSGMCVQQRNLSYVGLKNLVEKIWKADTALMELSNKHRFDSKMIQKLSSKNRGSDSCEAESRILTVVPLSAFLLRR